MPLTDKWLALEREHHLNKAANSPWGVRMISYGTLEPGWLQNGVQRLYRFPNNWGVSMVNHPMLHGYKYAWEGAVVKYRSGVVDDFELVKRVETLIESDTIIVFSNDEDANKFIHHAYRMTMIMTGAGIDD